ncbi:MAG: hypothetical protein A2Y40_08505 [Candidatus Margulisbacteria bacterium GWF2_35_9]|nr:MAG: hypothetical protein A2Y40_08505 [Candidatus Margulisbacteria bacterium GWF2_35_9]
MLIHILYKEKSVSGGGNQFLKALKKELIGRNAYADNIEQADAVLFNSHHDVLDVLKVKLKYPDKIFIQRLDGPSKLYNHLKDIRDDIAYAVNHYIADGTIFQSNWSKTMNYLYGLNDGKYSSTIINAPDVDIFNRLGKKSLNKGKKVHIVATSWSSNLKKGFITYQWLDNNLDFNKYGMLFIGNSPIKFKNIKMMNPLSSEELAKEIKLQDIFLTASQSDPCSNSLIEALHCGLPAIGLNDGGHPEIIGSSGAVFNNPEEIPLLLKKVEDQYNELSSGISLPNMNVVSSKYLEFIKTIYDDYLKRSYKPKNLNIFKYVVLLAKIYYIKLKSNLV